MNIAGPSRPHAVPGTRARDNYEEHLIRMVTQLDLADLERFHTVYEDRLHRGDVLSDHEVAYALLIQNARELAQFNADQALAQRLAVEAGGEPQADPPPR
ncbi:hypothetical protein K503DRAFT_692041 [Rhizopogon vinicolor AM-OR11-026]|uniref:Uncharacterized protein n=1 Tax=Rhizopogon vinicolor AM-OR11-026 TaxID=1314800 RepID=A0A1B7MZW3_9AGAM|nr:hypothetical protein K503DRAFT_692041 [Rhizopogon vinicolor AM-OR11-026]